MFDRHFNCRLKTGQQALINSVLWMSVLRLYLCCFVLHLFFVSFWHSRSFLIFLLHLKQVKHIFVSALLHLNSAAFEYKYLNVLSTSPKFQKCMYSQKNNVAFIVGL